MFPRPENRPCVANHHRMLMLEKLSMNSTRTLVAGMLGAALSATTLLSPAMAWANPAEDALREAQGEVTVKQDAVQNRFFVKSQRFEIAPVLGIVPNNPMVSRYTGGVLLAYHFSENFAVGGQIIYSPDLGKNDLKGLTNTLVQIAHSSDQDVEFQQPLDKMVLGATFSANWIPVYGKINLIGETVVNFDLYMSGGLGMMSIAKYYAVYDAELARTDPSVPPVNLVKQGSVVKVPVNLAIGTDLFLTQTLALKLEARSYLYVDKVPQYDPDVPVSDNRLYNVFIASAGLSMYFPKMDDRRTEF